MSDLDLDRLGVLCPYLKGKRVVVMPGHVNNNWGIRTLAWKGPDAYDSENEINLDVAVAILGLLERAGAAVRLIHGSFDRKFVMVRRLDPAYVLEVHVDAVGEGTPPEKRDDVTGFSAWVADQGTNGPSTSAARLLVKALRATVPIPPHGDYPGDTNDALHDVHLEQNPRRGLFDRLVLPAGTPLVLLEMGYGTNLRDCSYLATAANHRTLAMAVVVAMNDFFAV